MNFTGSNILSVNQFDRDSIDYIFSVADKMQPYARRKKRTRVLDGAILGNLFFEPSTRTRVSFGTAFNLLGGEVRETTGMESSAIAKGESLYDTARVLSSYSDVIAMRHPKSGSVKEFASGSRVPVINGGDGANEHPTQALLDLYTIEKELAYHQQSIDNMHICMIGDLKYGRTVHSLSTLLSMYKNIKFTLISPRELSMPESVLATLENAGHQVTVTEKVDGIVDADIVYQTRIQQERFASPEDADQYRGKFRLNQEIYTKHYKPNTVIMHPLPRDSRAEANELDNDLNQNPNLAIFRQADNGVLIRMALFALTLGVVDQVDKHECDVIWYSEKSQL
ncbi:MULTISPECIES: aspartate carbamoyltransferase [Idiomarina]|jgi:aspartate carbamoyltransferase catalytic subunit|uniref:Aspartate carbamoyltransferase n=1 Tax=Idiomarina zobellii TaxID=86103 RepID=A0A837NH22_9GAMM|nr:MULTISPECIES: aspartate carbamoyltransferase [Idiomarina]KTG27661.1 aspartate carbamoyltransferase [Idiomarina sp. H105]OAF04647.1 aspartate carbamoyltransferase [Idiomarina sp. WRN-38]KPD23525.1 aspartate carbamoyltransferase [Idiomarina zobellii]MCH2455585.1 aspartate carbamoyltransferase [Idiomarina sp.]MCJ8316373.1 aspartate carbamoyltransferase [Idiomarina sp.]